MIVIADTGPLISLCILGQTGLLQKLYTDYFICETVFEEFKNNLPQIYLDKYLSEFQQKTKQVKSTTNPYSLPGIDDGEAESLLLFDEMKADIVLLDDGKARKYAKSANIPVIGTIGILMEAKRFGFVPELRPLFISLRQNKRYYATELLNNVLASVNEAAL